jgi:hypothetical protein
MLVALGALSTTLGAQSRGNRTHAIGFGFVATVGDNWQVETAELGYVHRPARGLAAISLAARVGTFINESMMVGGTRGFVTGLTLSGRTRMKSIAQLGQEDHGTGIGLDMTLEVTGYRASQSPLSQGSRWMAVSVLPAISIGNGDRPHFALVIGPTAFFSGSKPAMRGLLALRAEAPLARRERRP